MAHDPAHAARTCADLIVSLCRADSSGVSVVEPGADGMEWSAAAGDLAGRLEGAAPWDGGVLRADIADDCVLLFDDGECVFPALRGLGVRSRETLLALWRLDGGQAGMLWAMRHTPEGRFDAEDARLLGSLARHAAAAHRMQFALTKLQSLAGSPAREGADRFQARIGELHHRTRNLLALIRSISNRTCATSKSLADFSTRFNDRLSALARINDLLARLDNGERIAVDDLIRAELRAYGALESDWYGPQVRLTGPAGVGLRASMVQILALALHELASNAARHGALARPGGRLDVSWERMESADGQSRLQVTWRESGVPGADRAEGFGYGRELIEKALPYQLEADVAYDLTPDGAHCVISAMRC